MGDLIYGTMMSVDGYTEDAEGKFDWAAPSMETHQYFNDLMRSVGTHIYGRRMYEVLSYWETSPTDESVPAVAAEFAQLWRDADKVVFSTTLREPSTARTRIVGDFDLDIVHELKRSTDGALSIGGPHIAAHAIRAGLVDEFHLIAAPVIVGGGTRALPDDAHLPLDLVGVRRFDDGAVLTEYAPRSR